MYARLLKPGLALVVAVMLLSIVFVSSAAAAPAPVTDLAVTASWDGQMEVHLAMNVPADAVFRQPGDPGSWRDGAVVDVFFSPTRYFSVRPDDPATLLPGEYWDERFPDASGPFPMDVVDSGLDHDTTYKVSVFFGVFHLDTGIYDWSPATETTMIAYLPLPAPIPLVGHQIRVHYGYDGIAWDARSVRLRPGDVLDVFLTNPKTTMTLYPPGSTEMRGKVTQTQPRTLWSLKGAGFAYRVPDVGPSGNYILYTPTSTGIEDDFSVDWSVTRGTGHFKLKVSNKRTMVRNRQTHVPLYWLRTGTITPSDAAYWSARLNVLLGDVGIIRSGSAGDTGGMRIDVYARYRGKTKWWIGQRHAIQRVIINAKGRFTAWVDPTINFPGDWHAIDGWRGKFKYRFYLPPYGGCTKAYSPVYSATWSGPK
jgi:hypothetical protein